MVLHVDSHAFGQKVHHVYVVACREGLPPKEREGRELLIRCDDQLLLEKGLRATLFLPQEPNHGTFCHFAGGDLVESAVLDLPENQGAGGQNKKAENGKEGKDSQKQGRAERPLSTVDKEEGKKSDSQDQSPSGGDDSLEEGCPFPKPGVHVHPQEGDNLSGFQVSDGDKDADPGSPGVGAGSQYSLLPFSKGADQVEFRVRIDLPGRRVIFRLLRFRVSVVEEPSVLFPPHDVEKAALRGDGANVHQLSLQ